MSNILITGGCGFIGSNLAVALRQAGHEVVALDNLSRRGSEILLRRVQDAGAAFQHGDIRTPEDLDRLPDDLEVMIECSAEPSVMCGTRGADARFLVNNNLGGAVNCLEWARQRQARVLFLSSSRVYPYDAINRLDFEASPNRFVCRAQGPGVGPAGISPAFPLDGYRSLYGATKLAAELLLREYAAQYDLPALILRCGVVAGPWQLGKVDQGVFTYWLASHYFNKPLKYIGFGGHGLQVRDLLHVDDLADLVQALLPALAAGRGDIYNAGGGPGAALSLRETTDLCRTITDHAFEIGSDLQDRPADVKWYITDNTATTARFGWQPRRDARRILQDTHDWLTRHEAEFRRLLG